MAHWHDHNPWADRLIYVPDLAELAQCLYHREHAYEQLSHWRSYARVDAYILLQPSGLHEAGIRYGKDGPEYFSPYFNTKKLEKLARKYAPERFPAPAAREAGATAKARS